MKVKNALGMFVPTIRANTEISVASVKIQELRVCSPWSFEFAVQAAYRISLAGLSSSSGKLLGSSVSGRRSGKLLGRRSGKLLGSSVSCWEVARRLLESSSQAARKYRAPKALLNPVLQAL